MVAGLFIFIGGHILKQLLKQENTETLCQQFLPLVKKYARKYRFLEDAEQEAWLILVQAIHSYNPAMKVPLAGYLESKIKFEMFNFCRSERGRQQKVVNDISLTNLPADDAPELLVEQKFLIKSIQRCIRQMPLKQQYVLVRNIINQYKLNRIAYDMGITTSAVYQLKKRALARLKKVLF